MHSASQERGPSLLVTVRQFDFPVVLSQAETIKIPFNAVNIESDLDPGNTMRSRRDAGEREPAEKGVVLGAGTLTLVNLDEHAGLVVGVGGEDFGLLGGKGSVSFEDSSRDTTGSLDSERARNDLEQEQVLSLLRGVTGEDRGLDGSTMSNGFVRIDALVELLSVEEVGNELGDPWDTSGTTDQGDLVDVGFVDPGITENLLDGVENALKKVLAQLLEKGTSEGGAEVDTFEQRVDFDGSGGSEGKDSLGTLAGGTETTQSTRVGEEVFLVLALEFLDKVADEPVVKVLAAQVGVTGGGLDLGDAFLDFHEGDVETSPAEIKDKDVAFTDGVIFETVSDCSGGGFADGTEDVQATDETGLLRGLTLAFVEVGGGGNYSIGDGTTEVRLGGLFHLSQDHGRYFFGRLETKLESRLRSVEKRSNSRIPYPRHGIVP
jgi:hypothetical protein